MEPISSAIIGAVSKLSETAVVEGYQYLKSKISAKCGHGSDIDKAIEELKRKPQSRGRQSTLLEEVEDSCIQDDADIIAAAETLLDRVAACTPTDNRVVKQEAGNRATQINQQVTGNGNTLAGRDVVITQKHTIKTSVTPRPTDITEEQVREIMRRIHELAQMDKDAGKGNTHGKRINRFKAAMNISAVPRLDASHYDEAITWLQQQAALTRPSLRRTNNEGWRKSHYSGLWAKWSEKGLSKDDIYPFAERLLKLKKPITSLKQLGERDIKKLYDHIMRSNLKNDPRND